MHHFTARSDPKIAALGADSTVEVAWLDTGHDVLGKLINLVILLINKFSAYCECFLQRH